MSDTSRFAEKDQPPSTPQLCMDIVRDYGNGNISKVEAVKSILAAFSESAYYEDTPQDQLNTAVGTYIDMLDQHDNSRKFAATRGRRSRGDLVGEGSDKDDRASAVALKRPHLESPGARMLKKKRSPDKSLFAWLDSDAADNSLLTPSQELTCKLVQNHSIDIKASKLRVLSAKRVPELPDSEWNNVLSGKAVNLDVAFSGLYSTSTDNRAIENIGDLELHFGAAKPAKSVETHGDWVIAWRVVFRATRFIFPHREAELEDYNDYITSYFASIHPSAHWRVLNLDKATRKLVGAVNDVSLNEFNKFRYLETRYLQGHGIGKSNAPPQEKSKEITGADSSWRKLDPCHLWNEGKCTHQASTCKYRHICDTCRGSHRRGSCPQEKATAD
jgi:hypothetical protein